MDLNFFSILFVNVFIKLFIIFIQFKYIYLIFTVFNFYILAIKDIY